MAWIGLVHLPGAAGNQSATWPAICSSFAEWIQLRQAPNQLLVSRLALRPISMDPLGFILSASGRRGHFLPSSCSLGDLAGFAALRAPATTRGPHRHLMRSRSPLMSGKQGEGPSTSRPRREKKKSNKVRVIW